MIKQIDNSNNSSSARDLTSMLAVYTGKGVVDATNPVMAQFLFQLTSVPTLCGSSSASSIAAQTLGLQIYQGSVQAIQQSYSIASVAASKIHWSDPFPVAANKSVAAKLQMGDSSSGVYTAVKVNAILYDIHPMMYLSSSSVMYGNVNVKKVGDGALTTISSVATMPANLIGWRDEIPAPLDLGHRYTDSSSSSGGIIPALVHHMTNDTLRAAVFNGSGLDSSDYAYPLLKTDKTGSAVARETSSSATYTLKTLKDQNDSIQTDLSTLTSMVSSLSISAPTASVIADAVWDEPKAGHTTASTYGKLAGEDNTAIAALNNPTTAAIVDAVWDEPTSGHTGAGTAGKAQGLMDASLILTRNTIMGGNPSSASSSAHDINDVIVDLAATQAVLPQIATVSDIPSTPTPRQAQMLSYMWLRNSSKYNATTRQIKNDSSAVVLEASISTSSSAVEYGQLGNP